MAKRLWLAREGANRSAYGLYAKRRPVVDEFGDIDSSSDENFADSDGTTMILLWMCQNQFERLTRINLQPGEVRRCTITPTKTGFRFELVPERNPAKRKGAKAK